MKTNLAYTVFLIRKRLLMYIMRVSIFLFCTTFFALSPNSVISENSKLKITENKLLSVHEVFHLVMAQTDYEILYEDDIFKDLPKVEIKKGTITTNKLLKRSLPEEYDIIVTNNKILIKEKESVVDKKIQQLQVSGIITDKSGQPLPGANIIEKGTSNGVQTDFDGNFSLVVTNENAILVISYLGFKTQEVSVNGQSNIQISLEDSTAALDEVVVVGYGTQKKANITGSVATISTKDITVVPTSNVTGTLAGRLPGLIVDQNTGRPGSDIAGLFIRGFGANNNNNTDLIPPQQEERPLYIVDGFIRNFVQLDPNEIESITILKDASAAVYGVRAAAGVVLVTTKRGKIGKPEITLNSNYTMNTNTTFPEYANYLQYKKIWELRDDGGDAAADVNPASGFITTERFNALESGANPGTDWWRSVTKNITPMYNHSLSVSGGSEKAKYFVNLGFLDQGTIWKTNDEAYKRFNATINLDAKISKNLKATVNFGWRREERESINGNQGDFFSIGFAHPAMPIDIPGGLNPIVNPSNGWSPVVTTNRELGGYEDRTDDIFNGGFGLDFEVPGIKGLTFGFKAGILEEFRDIEELNKPITLFAQGDNGLLEQVVSEFTTLRNFNFRNSQFTTQLSANYNVQLGKHDIGALLLRETFEQNNKNFGVTGNIVTENLLLITTADPTALTLAAGGSEYGRVGLVGRLNYNYDQKYLLEFSFRNDQSSYFPEATRTGFFPGLSVGWIASNEGFFENVNFINRLKFRASAARLGNDEANVYDYIEGFNIIPIATNPNGSLQPSTNGNAIYNGYVFDGDYQLALRSLGTANPAITWQQADLFNAGVEMSFLKNKLSFEFEVFYRERFDLLALDNTNINIPTTAGSDEPLRNIESMNNRGFESILSYRDQIGELNFNIRGNVSWTREKYGDQVEITQGDVDLDRISLLSGQWVNREFGYVFDGFFTQDDIDNLTLDYNGQNNLLGPGDIKVKDINDDGIIDDRDQVVVAKSNVPEWQFGLSTEFAWKNFDMTMFWQGAAGFHQEMTAEERGLNIPQNGPRTPFAYLADNIWTPENQGVGAEFPVDLIGPTNNFSLDKYWINSSYVRLKNLAIGYTIPSDVVSKMGASKLRLYVSGTNLLTFDSMGLYPFDPESGGRNVYPNQKAYTLGINLTF